MPSEELLIEWICPRCGTTGIILSARLRRNDLSVDGFCVGCRKGDIRKTDLRTGGTIERQLVTIQPEIPVLGSVR